MATQSSTHGGPRSAVRRALRVAVVSHQPLVVQALVFALRVRHVPAHVVAPDWLRWFLAETGGPTMVVVDTTMWSPPWFGVVDIVREQNRTRPRQSRVQVLALCDADEGATVAEALSHRVDDALWFSQPLESLCTRIELAGAPVDGTWPRVEPVQDAAARAESVAGDRRRGPDDAAALTPRERQLLHMVADGHSPGDIAQALHLSVLTVRTHLQRARTKLGVHSTVAAAALAAGWSELRSGPRRSPPVVMRPDRHGRASA